MLKNNKNVLDYYQSHQNISLDFFKCAQLTQAAVASVNAAPASNNDDLQQEMQRIFRPEKLMAQFKAYLSPIEPDHTSNHSSTFVKKTWIYLLFHIFFGNFIDFFSNRKGH